MPISNMYIQFLNSDFFGKKYEQNELVVCIENTREMGD